MASKKTSTALAVPYETAIVIPSLELPHLSTAVAELQTEKEKLPALQKQAEAIIPTDPDSYAALVRVIDLMQEIEHSGEKKMRPFLDVSNDVTAWLHTQRKNQEQAAKLAYTPHLERAQAYKRQEREAAAAEERRINDENRKRAEEAAAAQRKADEAAAVERRKARVAEIRGMLKRKEISNRKSEQLLREAGAIEEADKAKAAADAEQTKANVGSVKVLPNLPTVEGRRAGVEYLTEMIDGNKLVEAFSAAHNPYNAERVAYLRKFVMANESEVRKEAKEVKDVKKMTSLFPGFKFTEKDRV